MTTLTNHGYVKRGLYWFRHDIRMHDLPALEQLATSVNELAFVYVIPPYRDVLDINANEDVALSMKRRTFLEQSLYCLHTSLQKFGHNLIVLHESSASTLKTVIEDNQITHLGVSEYPSLNEDTALRQLQSECPSLTIVKASACSLFDSNTLPFDMSSFPTSFSRFRKQVETHISVKPCLPVCKSLPSSFVLKTKNANLMQRFVSHPPFKPSLFSGGEQAGINHLKSYFTLVESVLCYKQTRNALDEWRHSTKFSPWLANGCISPRLVFRELMAFENSVGKNESTYWIYFELLWREFFHWAQIPEKARWFSFRGLSVAPPTTDFDTSRFINWCSGNTKAPLVDACMRQLAETGYMSNRGRQLVASYFVHELNLDWRYGASWFEHCLIDYDCGSNWGNWLYLAGVGHDPRGHRKFDIEKQTALYDPNGTFQSKWLSRGAS